MSDVCRRVTLRLARDQADERLLHVPALRDAVRVDAEAAHAVVRPEVAADAGLHAGVDEAHAEVAAQRLTLTAEQALR